MLILDRALLVNKNTYADFLTAFSASGVHWANATPCVYTELKGYLLVQGNEPFGRGAYAIRPIKYKGMCFYFFNPRRRYCWLVKANKSMKSRASLIPKTDKEPDYPAAYKI